MPSASNLSGGLWSPPAVPAGGIWFGRQAAPGHDRPRTLVFSYGRTLDNAAGGLVMLELANTTLGCTMSHRDSEVEPTVSAPGG